ncbi:MAG: sigma-54 dependent transcriptional regulator [Candidatus Sumerlaeota bacterium]|nr:sigma-54 dependent transcriptional regulator [Candidatus Sumerlaeota bacterium]
MTKTPILVIAGEDGMRKSCMHFLLQKDFEVKTAPYGAEAVNLALQTEFHAAVIDGSGADGEVETVRRVKEVSPDTEIIVLVGDSFIPAPFADLNAAIFDHLSKPFSPEELNRSLNRALERRSLVLENRNLTSQLRIGSTPLRSRPAEPRSLAPPPRAAGMSACLIGESPAMTRIRRFVEEVASDDITVLIRGESGTGKNVVARLIHDQSGRARTGEFVRINCPAIPETLLESELFGHESGAFTGAERRKPGRFELAAEGTILLDEIAEIPPALQAKLLQAIEHKQFTRLGGNKTIRVNSRIVAATNAPLENMISQGRFREDLFYRLNEYCIYLPPLRQRTEDIPLLAQYFLGANGGRNGRHDLTLSPETMSCLVRHQWPGNVRELESVIKRFVISGREEDIIDALELHSNPAASAANTDALREVEIQTIFAALLECRWNQRKAAKALGISYSALRRRIAKYDLKSRPCLPSRTFAAPASPVRMYGGN